jgi:dienelactone hydrolase
MGSGVLKEWDRLADFTARQIAFGGDVRRVFVAGEGPGVLVMSELPGITPEVGRFARYVRDAGFTVYMPDLFGVPGKPFDNGYMLVSALKICISKEFCLFSSGDQTSPIVNWLRDLAALAHKECGGRGVGAVGMCLTGNFALAMMLEPAMLAPVLAQPSLPVNDAAGLHISPQDLQAVADRLQREDLTVLAYRFAGDRLCPAARFDALSAALGSRLQARTLPDEAAKQGAPVKPHSVLTIHLIDEPGEPTRAALDEILTFFAKRLR